MNLSDALAYDTEQARKEIEANEEDFKEEICDLGYAMTAFEVIDILKIEIARLNNLVK